MASVRPPIEDRGARSIVHGQHHTHLNTPEKFLHDFFADRHLRGPGDQPLYRYRIRTSEFRELGDVLGGGALDRGPIDRSAAMLFCLWAAEWWHRHYEGGPWKWRPLLATLGYADFAPGNSRYPELQGIVATGLAAWRRPVLMVGRSRAFLATLACEGGLPMKLLLRGQTHLRAYLRGVLQEYKLFGSGGIPPHELAERVCDRLPKTWCQDVVYQLSGELIAEVWRLQRELGDTETPVLDLDRARPGWRDELPVVVTDDVARTLLNGLLLDAVAVARGGRIRVRWNVILTPAGDDEWEIRGEFDLPATMGETEFDHLFGDHRQDERPHRFDLGVRTGRHPFEPLALATAMHDHRRGGYFGIEQRPAARRRVTIGVTQPRTLVARTPEDTLQSNEFPGGAGMSDLPWVFAPQDLSVAAADPRQVYRLVGQGSVRRREPWALVAVNEGTVAESGGNSHGDTKPIGSIRNEVGRRVYCISGEVAFKSPEGSCNVVKTGTATDSQNVEYYLVGRNKIVGRGGTVVFLGGVALRETSDGDFLRTVPESDLRWKPDRPGGRWRPYSSEAVEAGSIAGAGLLRYVRNGEWRHSVSASILPAKADIKYRPSEKPDRGEIVLSGFGDIQAAVPWTEGLTATGRHRRDGYHLVLEAEGPTPQDVSVWIDWAGIGRLALELPFPTKRAVFLAADGGVLPDRARMAVGSMPGVSVDVVVPEAADFELQGTYRGKDAAQLRLQLGLFIKPLESKMTGHHTLDLTLVQRPVSERLNLSEDDDGTVKLQVFSNDPSASLPPTCVIIRRFDLRFERRGDRAPLVGLEEHSWRQVSPDTLAGLEVLALPLLDPDPQPIRLSGCVSDVWVVPEDRMAPGPYLILGREGDWERARPFLWHVMGMDGAGEDIATEPCTVAEAYGGRDGSAVSAARFEPVARALANDIAHSDWSLVFSYLQHSSLPVATFPLLRSIALNPAAAAAAAVRAGSGRDLDVLWERLQDFPFSWWQIPLHCWQSAFECFADHLRRDLGTAITPDRVSELVEQHVGRRITRIAHRLPGLHAALGFVRAAVLGCRVPDEALRIIRPEMLEILGHQFVEHRSSFPARAMKNRDIPHLPGLGGVVHRLSTEHPWSRSLFMDRTHRSAAKTRPTFLDAPAVAGTLVLTENATSDAFSGAIRGVRALNARWFDEALRLAQLIGFGHRESGPMGRLCRSESNDGVTV